MGGEPKSCEVVRPSVLRGSYSPIPNPRPILGPFLPDFKSATMRIFLAGIMQGSHVESLLHGQDYRAELKRLLGQYLPEASVYDPLADHPRSLGYDAPTGLDVFLRHNRMCREVDVLVAFLPEASMGTAIEMWEAHQHGAVVVTISPMRHNWAVRFLSHELYANLQEFEASLVSGRLADRIRQLRQGTQKG